MCFYNFLDGNRSVHHKDVATESSKETPEEHNKIYEKMSLMEDVEKKAHHKIQGISQSLIIKPFPKLKFSTYVQNGHESF